MAWSRHICKYKTLSTIKKNTFKVCPRIKGKTFLKLFILIFLKHKAINKIFLIHCNTTDQSKLSNLNILVIIMNLKEFLKIILARFVY